MNQAVGFILSGTLATAAVECFIKFAPIKVNYEQDKHEKALQVLRSEDNAELANFKFKK